jgi:hydroxylamine reductase (hybrid-cluster protein)
VEVPVFCVQCEQSNKGGCAVKIGSCGKSADVADMQDVLLRVMLGVSVYASRAAAKGASDAQVDAFTPYAWFTTLPQFLTPEVLGVLVEKFDLRRVGDPQEDLAGMLQAA